MTRRERCGARRYRADVKQHDGTVDLHGQPSTLATAWTTVVAQWPCEVLTTAGGEILRGKQVSAQTTHVFYGDFVGGDEVTPDMKVTVNGVDYHVLSALDMDGQRREIRVEAKVQR